MKKAVSMSSSCSTCQRAYSHKDEKDIYCHRYPESKYIHYPDRHFCFEYRVRHTNEAID